MTPRPRLLVLGLVAPLALVACTGGTDTCGDPVARGTATDPRPASYAVPAVRIDPDVTMSSDSAALSPDGETLVVACDGELCRWDTATGRRLDGGDLGGGGTDLVWAGDTLVSSSGATYDGEGQVTFADAAGGGSCTVAAHEVAFATDGGGGSVTFTVAADDETMASTAEDGRVGLWSVGERARTGWLDVDLDSPTALALSPDGSLLAVGGPGGPVEVHDLGSGEQVAGIDERLVDLTWSPDGTALAGVTADRVPLVLDTGSWESTAAPAALAGRGTGRLAWSPDSAHLALTGLAEDGTVTSWTPATGEVTAVADHGSELPQSVLWSPDGAWVYSVDSVTGARRTPVADARATGGAQRYPAPEPVVG